MQSFFITAVNWGSKTKMQPFKAEETVVYVLIFQRINFSKKIQINSTGLYGMYYTILILFEVHQLFYLQPSRESGIVPCTAHPKTLTVLLHPKPNPNQVSF